MKSKDRAAILSTQYLEEEAATMCDRVAILVSGQLRWAPGLRCSPGCHAIFSLGFCWGFFLLII